MSKYLAAQKLNRRVTIQRKVASQDSWGQPLDSWEAVATVWASILFESGSSYIAREMHTSDTEISRPAATIRIRIRLGITAGMRVLAADGTVYDIRAVIPDRQDSRFLDLGVATGANDG